MKKSLLALALILLSWCAQAQHKLTVFAEDGQKFWLIVSGDRINDKPASRVTTAGISDDWVKIKILFADEKLAPVDENMGFTWGADETHWWDITVALVPKQRKGKNVYVTRSVNAKEIGLKGKKLDPAEKTGDDNSHLGDTPPPAGYQRPAKKPAQPKANPVEPESEGDKDGDVENVDINMMGMKVKADSKGNVSMDMNVDEMEKNAEKGQVNTSVKTNSRTTTTTTTRNGVTTSKTVKKTTTIDPELEQYEKSTVTTAPAKPAPAPAPAAAPTGCKAPMAASSFNTQLSAIKRQGFEDTKVKMMGTLLKNNCLSLDQVKSLMKELNFEANKLKIAKDAYAKCTQKGDYIAVSELFNFSASTEELTEFIGQQE